MQSEIGDVRVDGDTLHTKNGNFSLHSINSVRTFTRRAGGKNGQLYSFIAILIGGALVPFSGISGLLALAGLYWLFITIAKNESIVAINFGGSEIEVAGFEAWLFWSEKPYQEAKAKSDQVFTTINNALSQRII